MTFALVVAGSAHAAGDIKDRSEGRSLPAMTTATPIIAPTKPLSETRKRRIALAVLISLELLCLSSLSAPSTYQRQNVKHPAPLSRLLSTSPVGLIGQMSRIGEDYHAYLFKPGTRRGIFDSFLTMLGVVAAVTFAGAGLYSLKDLNK